MTSDIDNSPSDDEAVQRMLDLYEQFQSSDEWLEQPEGSGRAAEAEIFYEFVQRADPVLVSIHDITLDDCEKIIVLAAGLNNVNGRLERIGNRLDQTVQAIESINDKLHTAAVDAAYTVFSLRFKGSPEAEDIAFRSYMNAKGYTDFTEEDAQEVIARARNRRGQSGRGRTDNPDGTGGRGGR